MPRTYIKNRQGSNYSPEGFIQAVNNVENKHCIYRGAEEH